MANTIPFEERKTVLRGILDLATGAYPAFVFGGALGRRTLPVFHFHDVTRSELEPYFAYLAENGYRTVTADRLARVARGEDDVEPRTVALSFDDAWASLWSVVLPLLHAYDLTAITYVSPSRIEDADACRSVEAIETTTSPVFATWPEIAALSASGRVDVQAHTLSHAMIFSAPEIIGFVTPETTMPLLSWPRCGVGDDAPFLDAKRLGCPLLPQRSRISDAHGYQLDNAVPERCCEHVRQNGGTQFFKRPEWADELRQLALPLHGRFETDAERDMAIERELALCRDILASRLNKPITQICMPWAVCGRRAEALARNLGYTSVVADTLFGKRYVVPGTNPYRLMRLKYQYIPLLPGRGRRTLLTLRKGATHA